MPADNLSDDEIIADAYADRVRDLFKVFVEAVATGEPDRDAVVRFRRGLQTARRIRDLAVEASKDTSVS